MHILIIQIRLPNDSPDFRRQPLVPIPDHEDEKVGEHGAREIKG